MIIAGAGAGAGAGAVAGHAFFYHLIQSNET
jgi:hypothetical protein